MYYVNGSSTISHQASFRNPGFAKTLQPLAKDSEVIKPDYKEFIDAKLIRRMSQILRMSIATSVDCLAQAEEQNTGAIVVGTGLGCLQDTEKFLQTIKTVEGLIPPTSFIQSTHNTISGQISLVLSNHNYNMTHTQNSLSFERAMEDAMLLLDEGTSNVLVGAADEAIPVLDSFAKNLGLEGINLTSGASFLSLSQKKSQKPQAVIEACAAYGRVNDTGVILKHFMSDNGVGFGELDLIINIAPVTSETEDIPAVEISDYCGQYLTNTAFAVQVAIDLLSTRSDTFAMVQAPAPFKRILVYNNLVPGNLGLTLLRSVEA